MKFDAILVRGKKTATGIEVPESVIDALGEGKRPAVVATVNGYQYRTTVGSMGGRYMLPFSADHRSRSGLAAGDAVAVEVIVDREAREVDVPEDLAAALELEPRAAAAFEALAYSRKRWFALNVESAKAAETRRKRVAGAIDALLALNKK